MGRPPRKRVVEITQATLAERARRVAEVNARAEPPGPWPDPRRADPTDYRTQPIPQTDRLDPTTTLMPLDKIERWLSEQDGYDRAYTLAMACGNVLRAEEAELRGTAASSQHLELRAIAAAELERREAAVPAGQEAFDALYASMQTPDVQEATARALRAIGQPRRTDEEMHRLRHAVGDALPQIFAAVGDRPAKDASRGASAEPRRSPVERVSRPRRAPRRGFLHDS